MKERLINEFQSMRRLGSKLFLSKRCLDGASERERSLTATLDRCSDGIVVTDQERELVFANSAFFDGYRELSLEILHRDPSADLACECSCASDGPGEPNGDTSTFRIDMSWQDADETMFRGFVRHYSLLDGEGSLIATMRTLKIVVMEEEDGQKRLSAGEEQGTGIPHDLAYFLEDGKKKVCDGNLNQDVIKKQRLGAIEDLVVHLLRQRT
jgi:hypothetical protein